MTQTARNTVKLKRNGLIVECVFNDEGRLERKIERCGLQSAEYAYRYDAKGHLTEVRRDGALVESYQYNPKGQRIAQKREYRGFSDSTGGVLRYDGAGRLVRAGDTAFYYDRRGALAERCDSQGTAKYTYGNDTMLDKVVLPFRTEIRYEYDAASPINPVRRFKNGALAAEYVWANPFQLAIYRDHSSLLEYTFQYDDSGVADRVRIGAFTPAKRAVA